jgi:type I restriction enzyme M protein
LEEQARPHWEAAREAKQEADRLADRIKQIEGQARPDQGALEELRGRERSLRDTVREEQTKGDALYWSAFNLDLKNPRATAKLEHLPPEQLVASIVEKERQILAIMGEIEGMLAPGPKGASQ